MNAAQKQSMKNLMRAAMGLAFGNASIENRTQAPTRPKRILLVNGAHIGDLVISTSLLPILRSAFPAAEIGFAVGSWSKMVVADHPHVAHIHVVDHWFLNRERKPLASKVAQYRRTRAQALREMKAVGYEISICLHAFYSDLMRLTANAEIPFRVGFREGIFSNQAHVLARYPDNPFITQGECLTELLRALQIAPEHLHRRKAALVCDSEESLRELCDLLQVKDLAERRYSVVHIGSGAPARELSPHVWREVAARLARTQTLIFTGKGKRDEANIREIIHGLDNCVNATGKLSWRGFVTSVRHADVLYGVESMAGHVAAAVNTRSVLVYAGTAGPARWRPESSLSTVWTVHVPCSPCGLIGGCKDMTCIRGITADDILNPLGPIY